MRRFGFELAVQILAITAVGLGGCARGSAFDSDSSGDGGVEAHAVLTPTQPSQLTEPAATPSSKPSFGPISAYPPGAVATFALDQPSSDHTAVLVYGQRPSADSNPLATLEAPTTPGGIAALAFDSKRQLYVLDYSGRISVFASGASDYASPIRVINPDGLFSKASPTYAYAIAVNSRGEIYVAIDTDPQSSGPESIFAYASNASGAAEPVRVISGPSTKLLLPTEIGFDENDSLYVGDYEAFSVSIFASDADGDVAPVRIACVTEGHTSMAVAPDGRLFVAPEGSSDTPGWSVRVYSPKGPLLGVIAGPDTGLDSDGAAPIAMAVDPWGGLEIIGANRGLRFGRRGARQCGSGRLFCRMECARSRSAEWRLKRRPQASIRIFLPPILTSLSFAWNLTSFDLTSWPFFV